MFFQHLYTGRKISDALMLFLVSPRDTPITLLLSEVTAESGALQVLRHNASEISQNDQVNTFTM